VSNSQRSVVSQKICSHFSAKYSARELAESFLVPILGIQLRYFLFSKEAKIYFFLDEKVNKKSSARQLTGASALSKSVS
jgi:hypothetical protein